MFVVGKHYTFQMYEGAPSDGPTEFGAKVSGYDAPLLKIEYYSGDEHIINTSSPAFISARPRELDELSNKLIGEFPIEYIKRGS